MIDKFSEVHRLRCYNHNEVENILEENGFELISTYGKDVKAQKLDDEIEDAFNVLVVARAQ